MENTAYVHGYSEREAVRLNDQAVTLADLLHHDTRYPAGSLVLEAGCGTGAQTVHLAKHSPGARIISMDISEESLEAARARAEREGISNVDFRRGDIFSLPFEEGSFDHVFVCFVLEHLENPAAALESLKRILKPCGTLTVIEGDHESTLFHPSSPEAWKTIRCLIEIQAALGGNSLVGRELYPLMVKAGFVNCAVSPRPVYADAGRPELVEGFTRNTYIAMVEGVREQALSMGLIDKKTWDRGIRDLYRAADPDGSFYYTFFKGKGEKPRG